MSTLKPEKTKGSVRFKSRTPRLLPFLAFGVAWFCSGLAEADPKFGDSSWVAPAMPIEGEYTSDGPRVAEPDNERGWETALRAPFRVLFFPLRLVARGLEAGVGEFGGQFLAPEPKTAPQPGLSFGPHLDLRSADDGLRGIGVGAAVKWTAFPTAEARMQASGTMSLKGERRARFRGTAGDQRPLGVQLQVDYEYRPDRSYYGQGNNTREADRAYYRLETTRMEAGVLYGASPLRRVRFLAGYSGMSPGPGGSGSPLFDGVYPAGSVPYEGVATHYLTYGIAGDLAVLDDLAAPSLGLHGRVELKQAAGLDAIAPDYTQWLVEGRAYVPVFARRRVLAVRALYAGVGPGAAEVEIPFYRLAVSENALRFAGYASQRFRDRQLILGRIEYRWVIGDNVSAVALYELGEVASHTGSFTLRNAHSSWGGGIRVGRADATAVRLDVATSLEGLHVVFRFGSDF